MVRKEKGEKKSTLRLENIKICEGKLWVLKSMEIGEGKFTAHGQRVDMACGIRLILSPSFSLSKV